MLNEPLFRLLEQTFGRVKTASDNEAFRYRVERRSDGKTDFKRTAGEEYLVNCPVCGHISRKKFRLSISYMFGQRLPEGPKYYGAHCWNMKCKVVPLLLDMLKGKELPKIEKVEKLSFRSFEEIAADCIAHVESPIVTPAELSPDVSEYLRSRSFDPAMMSAFYRAGRIEYSLRSIAIGRLYIPMVWADAAGTEHVVAWQGREIQGRENVPKYFTAPGSIRGAFLYGQPCMRYYPGGVVLEGPTDVWRTGFPAVGMWGSSLSPYQAQLISNAWGLSEYPIVVYGDPGFEKQASENAEAIRRVVRGGHRVFYIVPDRDAGSDTNRGVWERIDYECHRRGLPLLPRKRIAA